ncbi:hypothetical protein BGZ80_002627 [Entomortierella chlamydospora]|uniref:FAD-binding domain-containing protein n=1 Tax=Entomortierella chlamydospora TaxID=101097 RepID=A0A9P6MQ78_9FUNG|nr:hypothetical protein BGZ80_002627 [Entomortierella chlamydospora]
MPQHAPPSSKPLPEVLIVGAGIGSLTLAILLEQLNIPYHIFERAAEVKPLGSAMSFGGHIFPAFEQLGIHKELVQVSKPYTKIDFFNANCKSIGTHDVQSIKDATGYDLLAFSRPSLYEILRKRVPAHKIHFRKKVLRTEEKEGRVIIHCSDNSAYSGDILVGADGAHSGVRQSLYRRLSEEGSIPKSDLEGFSIGYTTIVGVATPANPEKYPQLKEENSTFNQILYDDNCNCYIITLPDNQISWGFGTQLPKATLKEMQFRNSEWSPESSDSMLKEYRDWPCPLGGTMGEIFDATPKDLISKVFLEEKIFTTWYHSRTVLLGDACHKLHPAGGQGAANAIKDAIVLANCLYSMVDISPESITAAFKDYYRQRYSRAEEAFKRSVLMAKVLNGHKWTEKFARNVFLNHQPGWLVKGSLYKAYADRPQIAWLPLIENRGNGPVIPQENRKDDECKNESAQKTKCL